jgi:hypothetical protein
MFCAPGLIFDDTKGVSSNFNVLRARTHFWWYRGRQLTFLSFALPNSFSTVPRASGPIFKFFGLELIFGAIEGVGYRFHVLRARTHFRRYRGLPVPFICFALLDSFSAVSSASGPIFMFSASELIFGGTEGVWTRFRGRQVPFSYFARTDRFPRYRRYRVPFSCFARPVSFSAVLRASAPVFKFCAPRLVFDGTEGVDSYFHVLRARTHFWR